MPLLQLINKFLKHFKGIPNMSKKILYLNGDSWTSQFYNNSNVKKILFGKYDQILCDAKGGANNTYICKTTLNSITNFDNDNSYDICIFLSEALRGDDELKKFKLLIESYGTKNGLNFIANKLLELSKIDIESFLKKTNFNYTITTAFVTCPWDSKIDPMYKIICDKNKIKIDHECYIVSLVCINYILKNLKKFTLTEKQIFDFVNCCKQRIELLDKIGNNLHINKTEYYEYVANEIVSKM